MERRLQIHNTQYRGKHDVHLLFVMLLTVMGALTFLTVIVPDGDLASDLPYEISRTP